MDREGLADARYVLRDALEWRLSEDRWGEVDQQVQAMARALTELDAGAFRSAEATIELTSPTRARSAEDPPKHPIPEPFRERINELIHTLDGALSSPSEPDADEPASS